MLLLTDLTGAPDNKSIGIEYCQKYVKKYRRYPYRYYIGKVSHILAPVLKKYC